VRLEGKSRVLTFLLASLVLSACHRGTQEEIDVMTGRCTTRVRAKGPAPVLPAAPAVRATLGAIVGTLADSGGALPHYSILATAPGDNPNAPHATVVADTAGGFVFDALTPGRYRLFVRAFAHRADSADVDVVAGQVDTVRLRPQFFQCVR